MIVVRIMYCWKIEWK